MTTLERTRVDNTSARGEAPCIAACPINQDARDYVQLIARGRFEEAFRLVRSKNTFPASCGRICTRRCEDACRRSAVDEPIAIAWLKRFLSDKDFSPSLENRKARYQEKVAIVGAGPAGLTAANDLSLLGYKCVIFEELLEPGGMLRTGVPRYRLPGHSLDSDISDILRLGVELRTGVKLGLDITVDTLFEEDFKAVFIGIGAHKSLRLDVPGEDLAGVIPAVEFLRKISLGKTINLGKKVVVIGGGDTALDSARTALRVGAKEVTIVYRRSVEEMPCEKVGRLEAEEEGVRFKFLTSPVELLGNDGVKVVKCIKMELGEPDETVNKKLKAILRNAMVPIVCVGERVRDGNFKEFLKEQVEKTFAGLTPDDIGKCIIAYEPVWAISSNPGARPDTPESAIESIHMIREVLIGNWKLEIGNLPKVLYGGSVTSKNAADFIGQKEIDGILVGGASVNKDEFVKILSQI